MTMIVETGAGVEGANSYASTDEADEYCQLRGMVEWTSRLAAEKAAALVRATDYIEARYRAPAERKATTQGLKWPTTLDMGLPPAVKVATIVLASYALNGALSAPVTRGIKVEKVYEDGAGNEITFDDAAPSDPYPIVTAMLDGVASLRNAGGVVVGRLTL